MGLFIGITRRGSVKPVNLGLGLGLGYGTLTVLTHAVQWSVETK